MGLLSLLTWPAEIAVHSRPGQLTVYLLEKTTQVAAGGIEAVVGQEIAGTPEDSAEEGEEGGQNQLVASKKTGMGKSVKFLKKPIELVMHSRPGQLTVFLLEKTAQVGAWGVKSVVGWETTGPAKKGLAKKTQDKTSTEKDEETGTSDSGSDKPVGKSEKPEKTTGPGNEGYLIRAGQTSAKALRGVETWLHTLKGETPSTDTVKPPEAELEIDDRTGLVARKQQDAGGLVTWVYESALYALNPLNDIVLAVKLLDYTKGVVHVYRNKSSTVEESSPISPSKGAKFEVKDAGSAIKPQIKATKKSDVAVPASPTKPAAKSTPIPLAQSTPIPLTQTTPKPLEQTDSETPAQTTPIPVTTTEATPLPPTQTAPIPSTETTPITPDPALSKTPAESTTPSSDTTPTSHIPVKTHSFRTPRLSKLLSWTHREVSPKTKTGKKDTSNQVESKTKIAASPETKIEVQSVSVAAAADNTDDVQVPAEISADEQDKVDIKTKSEEGIKSETVWDGETGSPSTTSSPPRSATEQPLVGPAKPARTLPRPTKAVVPLVSAESPADSNVDSPAKAAGSLPDLSAAAPLTETDASAPTETDASAPTETDASAPTETDASAPTGTDTSAPNETDASAPTETDAEAEAMGDTGSVPEASAVTAAESTASISSAGNEPGTSEKKKLSKRKPWRKFKPSKK